MYSKPKRINSSLRFHCRLSIFKEKRAMGVLMTRYFYRRTDGTVTKANKRDLRLKRLGSLFSFLTIKSSKILK